MTVEEFDRTFKVGDKIKKPAWDKNRFIKIESIGIKYFEAENEMDYILSYPKGAANWQHYQEEKEQDLKDVFPYVEIEKYPDGRKSVYLSFGNKAEYKDDKDQFCDSEVITLQEAQERGLDLSPLFHFKFNLKSE